MLIKKLTSNQLSVVGGRFYLCLLLLFYLDCTQAEQTWPAINYQNLLVNPDEIYVTDDSDDISAVVKSPKFVSVDEAYGWLNFSEPVAVLSMHNIVRAYPLQILLYHKLIQDQINNKPVFISYSPSDNAVVAYQRSIKSEILDFALSDRVFKGNPVLYDEQTRSWWQHLTGLAIAGEMVGKRLPSLPVNVVSFEDFLLAFPGGQVMSRETGYARPYGSNPYTAYDQIDESASRQFHLLDRAVGVVQNKVQKLYPFPVFAVKPVIEDMIGKQYYVIFSRKGLFSVLDEAEIVTSKKGYAATIWDRKLDGKILRFHEKDGRILDKNTGSEWNMLGQAVTGPLRGSQLRCLSTGHYFMRSWLAFYPDAEIYNAAQ